MRPTETPARPTNQKGDGNDKEREQTAESTRRHRRTRGPSTVATAWSIAIRQPNLSNERTMK